MISFFRYFLLIALCSLASLHLYDNFIMPTNFSVGIGRRDYDLVYISFYFCGAAILAGLLPKKSRTPVEIFISVYLLLLVYSFHLYGDARVAVSRELVFAVLIALVIPVLVLRVLDYSINLKYNFVTINESYITMIVIAICVITMVILYFKQTDASGFSLTDIYQRRLQLREVIEPGSLFAYLLSSSANGFLPFLSFRSGYKLNFALFGLVCVLALVAFYVMGTRSTIIFVITAFAIGYLIRKDRLHLLPQYILYTFLFILCASSLELCITDYTYIGDHFVRRVLVVPGYLMGAYIETITNGILNHDMMTGSSIENITYYVGNFLFNNEASNANTNTFMLDYAQRGLIGLQFTWVATILILLCLKAAWNSNKSANTLFVAYCFPLILTEQKLATSLLSSGIAILILIAMFSKLNSKRRRSFL